MLDHFTFSNKSVGEYYNAHFVNISLDGERGEGAALAGRFAIRGYPTLLFFDKNGNLIMQDAGYRGPRDFIETGKTALATLPSVQ
jgi:thioredoxin-related protein